MARVKFCRSCLATDVQLDKVPERIGSIFKSVTGLPLKSEGASQLFCCSCKYILMKIGHFQEHCLKVDKLINDMLSSNIEIDDTSVKQMGKDINMFNNLLTTVKTVNLCDTCESNTIKQEPIVYTESELDVEPNFVKIETQDDINEPNNIEYNIDIVEHDIKMETDDVNDEADDVNDEVDDENDKVYDGNDEADQESEFGKQDNVPEVKIAKVGGELLFVVNDKDGENSDPEEKIPMKRKKKMFEWILINKFDSKKQAEEVLAKEKTWAINFTEKSEEGNKTYYKCNKEQCLAKRYLDDIATDGIAMYGTEDNHNHEITEVIEKELSIVVRKEVDELFDLHYKSEAMMNALSKLEDFKLPNIKQLNNYLCERRCRLYGKEFVNLAGLEEWLAENSIKPENPQDSFVIAYETRKEDEGFRFVVSSRYLLDLGKDAKILNVQPSSKIIWQNNSVHIVGTTDKHKRFHALCLVVSSTDHKDDYKFAFKTVKDNVEDFFKRKFKPTVLITDSSKTVQEAFLEEFQNARIRICWIHARRNMRLKLEGSVDDHEAIMKDIEFLHSLTRKKYFDVAAEMFLKKYDHEVDFITYFKDEWLTKNRIWYQGEIINTPVTNKFIEISTNDIKKSVKENLDILDFLANIKEVVNGWSVKYLQEPPYVDTSTRGSPYISMREWAKAYDWVSMEKQIKTVSRDKKSTCFRVPVADETHCPDLDSVPYSFDEYKDRFSGSYCWEVTLPTNKEDWDQGTCTCPQFERADICKHVIGVSIRLNYTEVPEEAKEMPYRRRRWSAWRDFD